MKNKVLIICGPTATGKTALGVRLAKTFGGEIISADSRQVYKGMDIATGKDIQEAEMTDGVWHIKGIPIQLLDIKEPTEKFSIAEFEQLAEQKIKEVIVKDKLPIVVGGTGFYIQSLTDTIDTVWIPPNSKLRERLSRKSADELLSMLEDLNPEIAESLNPSERKNKQRLIRRIEVANATETVHKLKKKTEFDYLIVCLFAEREILKERIFARIDKWFKNGAKEEVEKLLRMGVSWKDQSMTAIGYRDWRPFFEGKSTEEEVLQNWKNKEWQYATQQITWFRKQQDAKWFDITKENFEKEVEDAVASWYTTG